ncbi:uromodulin-like 1 [Syngnathoides biaculeatus]|uniref:uromodulin-like 1 n=1 Tax=Syngnathoides biaculeatus TaxID=300417 RepID=UPI002ADE03D0|nr:uromodulin-like 1 [Syngnathoides biaculeatus]
MGWMCSIWVVFAFLALNTKKTAAYEGRRLSASGYHLCIFNETHSVSSLVLRRVPYTVTKPCSGWLFWTACPVTLFKIVHQTEYRMMMVQVTRCCHGYIQIGSYCALSLNRSEELMTKPGSCPSTDGSYSRLNDCDWDVDCPNWQKCCERSGYFRCKNPARSANYTENGQYRFNATVTVKTDYQQLMNNEALLNHTRLLQAMVTGALQSVNLSVYYLASWPVYPYRTATSLLIGCSFVCSLHDVTSKLHFLLKHIQEVSAVTVEDVNECAHPALHRCSPKAQCSDTVGSYQCTCDEGYLDVDLRNPGTNCAVSPGISRLQAANITGSSFCVYWSTLISSNQTYMVVLSEGSEIISMWTTEETMMELRELQPGVLYNVTVQLHTNKSHEDILYIAVKTAARALVATTRLTNIPFTDDLHNTSSQAYKILTVGILDEIFRSLTQEMRALVNSGQVRIEIRNLSPGSVVVNFTVIFSPSQEQDIKNTSIALLYSLMNSSIYTMDENSTSISDFDECVPGENDCSQWATCTNTWGSYTCSCLDGFMDTDPQRPGRACQAPMETTTLPSTFSSGNTSPLFQITSSSYPAPNTIRNTLEKITGITPDEIDATKLTIHTIAATTPTRVPTTAATVPTSTFELTASTTATTTHVIPTLTPSTTVWTDHTTPDADLISNVTSHRMYSIVGDISVDCAVTGMTVTVTREFLYNNNIRADTLYLGRRECGVSGFNASHAQLVVEWNECITIFAQNDSYYMASVTLFNTMETYMSPNGTLEAPKLRLEVPIICIYMRSMLMSADFGSMGYELIQDVISGSGMFQVTVQLLNGTYPLPSNSSLSPEEAVVVEVSMNTSAEEIKVVIYSCWATPSQNPLDSKRFVFLDRRCALNMYTDVLMNGNSSTSRISVQIFSFVDVNLIYLHCHVQICMKIGSDSCVPDCVQRTTWSTNTIGRAFGSTGPLLKSEEGSSESADNRLQLIGLSFLGVALVLFFVIGFACLFYYQRNRIGHYNFTAKSNPLNITDIEFIA